MQSKTLRRDKLEKSVSADQERNAWRDRVLTKINDSGQDSKFTIGIVGALGTGDLGDEAMLVALKNELAAEHQNLEFVCFTTDPKVTYLHTGVRSFPLLDNVLRNNLFSMIFRNLGKLEKLMTVLLKKSNLISETHNGEFLMRIFYISFTPIWYHLTKSYFSMFVSRGIQRHIEKIENCNLIMYQGGAYLNSWNIKSRIYMYLFPAYVAKKKDIAVVGTGLNLGPYNAIDSFFIRKYFKLFDLIGVRDRSVSVRRLREILPSKAEQLHFSNDDAITLKHDFLHDLRLATLGISLKETKYIALNVHYWMLDDYTWKLAKDKFVFILKYLIDNYDLKVIAVPMIFSDHEEVFDIAAIREVLVAADIPSEKIITPDLPVSIDETVNIYANASLTLGSRHHSMVLSVANDTPTIAIVYDEYYHMKHKGVSDEYKDQVLLVKIDDLSSIQGVQEFLQKHELNDKP